MAGGEPPKWKGLFDWSMKYQDGTHPSNEGTKPVTSEDAKWFREAMAHYMQDFTERMRIIKVKLGADGGESGEAASLPEKEHLLDELIEIVESIDYARDLRSIGGLPILLALLQCEEPSLRWRAAEVLATCAQNNPPVQEWFMEAGAMPALIERLADEDGTVRQKALMALSCIIRHNDAGLTAFVKVGGLKQLVQATGDVEHRVQRKALQMLSYILRERPTDRAAAGKLGLISQLVKLLEFSDNDIEEAALGVAFLFTVEPERVHFLFEAEGLVDRVNGLQGQRAKLEGDDLLAVLESANLCTSLAAILSQPRSSYHTEDTADARDEAATVQDSKQAEVVVSAPVAKEPTFLLGAP